MASETPLHDLEIKVAEPTAEWHVAPDAPIVNGPVKEETWLRALAWVFVVIGFVFFLTTKDVATRQTSLVVTVFESIILIGLSQAVLVYLYRRRSNYIEAGTGIKRLQSKVPEGADLLVTVEVFRDGVLTGKDTGYIWLDNGTWYFKGLATAFRINQQDVVPIEAWPKRMRPDPGNDRPPRKYPLKSRLGRLEVRINVVDPYEDFAKRKRAKAFYREMFDWLVERPHDGIESLLPPLSVHPDIHIPRRPIHGGVVAGFVLVCIDAAVLFGLPRARLESDVGSFVSLAALILAGLLYSGVWLASVELRDGLVRRALTKKSSVL